MSANEGDLQIEDELAKGAYCNYSACRHQLTMRSPKGSAGPQVQDFFAIEEELRSGEGCAISGFQNRATDSEPYGFGRGR